MKKYNLEVMVYLWCGRNGFRNNGIESPGAISWDLAFVWTSLIGIILGSLSLGYWLGTIG